MTIKISKKRDSKLKTLKVEELPKGWAELFKRHVEHKAEDQKISISEVFKQITTKLLVDDVGPKEAARTIWCNTGDKIHFYNTPEQ